ncbi:MAG: hypothetical protein AAF289_19335 [Cyanobacteria bacterium P01_A01_bin.135]
MADLVLADLSLDSTGWLALSLGLVALSTTAVLVVALPAVVELGRAARSAEKLFDTLNRELPPVLDAMRATGQELSELTEGVGESVERAGQLVQQVDQGVTFVKQQAGQAKRTGGSILTGVQAAWRTFQSSSAPRVTPSPVQAATQPSPQETPTSHLQEEAAPPTPPAAVPEPSTKQPEPSQSSQH